MEFDEYEEHRTFLTWWLRFWIGALGIGAAGLANHIPILMHQPARHVLLGNLLALVGQT